MTSMAVKGTIILIYKLKTLEGSIHLVLIKRSLKKKKKQDTYETAKKKKEKKNISKVQSEEPIK